MRHKFIELPFQTVRYFLIFQKQEKTVSETKF